MQKNDILNSILVDKKENICYTEYAIKGSNAKIYETR